METIDILSEVRKAVAGASSTEQGLDALVPLTCRQASALINVVLEQERELMQLDRTLETARNKVKEILDGLSCFDFAKEVPEAEYEGDVFEIFVGEDITNCGRVFGHWSNTEQEFYLPENEGEQRQYIENTLFWRYPLPEPHEAFDIGEI